MESTQNNFLLLGLNKLALFISLPLFLYGFVFNAIPFFAIDIITRKKIKDHAFWSTFFLVLGLLFFPLFYLIELYVVSQWLPEFWMKIVFLSSLPFLGKFAFLWYIRLRKTIGRAKLLFMTLFNKETLRKLIKQQNDLFQQLDQLI